MAKVCLFFLPLLLIYGSVHKTNHNKFAFSTNFQILIKNFHFLRLKMVLFGILKELAQKEISDVLEKYSGTKVSP